jgi:glycosyltransferase involved in cell wall biosynthesis
LNSPSISVICASKNEERDINILLESFLKIQKSNIELIIIDDSTDKTKKIINNYILKDSRIFLINGDSNGCCEARNKGIKKSRYDYILFMTADSFFHENYISEISVYLNNNYDAVMVNSKVYNQDSVWADFIQSHHLRKLDKRKNYSPLTTQGYVVSKKAALNAGLIDSGKFKPNICRDWTLVKKMDKMNYKKIYLDNIYCYHLAPDNFKEFYITHLQRGIISAGYGINFEKRSYLFMYCKNSIKVIKFVLFYFLIIPWLIKCIEVSLKSKTRKFPLLQFLVIDIIKTFSFILGELRCIFKSQFKLF